MNSLYKAYFVSVPAYIRKIGRIVNKTSRFGEWLTLRSTYSTYNFQN